MIVTSVHVSFCLYLILMCDVFFGRRFHLPPLYAYTYYIRLMSIDPGRMQYTIQQLIIILVKYEYTIIMLFAIPIIVIIIIQYLRPCANYIPPTPDMITYRQSYTHTKFNRTNHYLSTTTPSRTPPRRWRRWRWRHRLIFRLGLCI